MRKALLLFILTTFILGRGVSQTQGNGPVKEKSKPLTDVQRATLYSIFPGGGQIYNHSYWKVPVIYAGFGVLTYSFIFYNKEYNEVRKAYIQSLNNQPITNTYYANVTQPMLLNMRESYKKSRDLSVIGIAGLYVFNLMDAAVDAHMKGFDVGDDLTLKIRPDYKNNGVFSYTGVSFRLNF